MKISVRHQIVFTACHLLLALMHGLAYADASAIEKFFGTYSGKAISDTGGELSERDLSVEISPYKEGFAISWVSITYKQDGKLKRKRYTVKFYPTERENVFGSEMRTDVNGEAVPLRPLRGDPYLWARLEGTTLVVYAMHIKENGKYDMQVYERTIISGGLKVRYTRVNEGALVRTVTGTLERIE